MSDAGCYRKADYERHEDDRSAAEVALAKTSHGERPIAFLPICDHSPVERYPQARRLEQSKRVVDRFGDSL
jgi:hypothetical protein